MVHAIASTQPLAEESGLIYYRESFANTTKGSATKGDTITKFASLETPLTNYANNRITNEPLTVTVAGTLAYATNMVNVPVRPGSVVINIAAPDLATLVDDGNGVLLSGQQAWGTVNYTTGVVTLNMAVAVGGAPVVANYVVDVEAQATLPSIQMKLTSATVRTQPYALRFENGLIESYTLRKRFGKNLDGMLASDLNGALSNELFQQVLAELAAISIGNTTFSLTVPAGVTRQEHLASEFTRVCAAANTTLLGNIGAGSVRCIVLGRDAAGVVSEIPAFKEVTAANTSAPHIFGTIKGIVIIRIPNAAQLGVNSGYAVHRGGQSFEDAIIFAPYMPLVVLPRTIDPQNPLKSAGGIASVSGFFSNNGFATGLTFA